MCSQEGKQEQEMLKKLKIHNFKCLVDFEIDLQPFTILIGPNASGKSTILQAIDLIKWFGEGNPKGFLTERGWEARDVRSKLTKDRNTTFKVHICIGVNANYFWDFHLHFPDSGKVTCSYENLVMSSKHLFPKPEKGTLSLLRRTGDKIWRTYLDSEEPIPTEVMEQFPSGVKVHNVKVSETKIMESIRLDGSVLSLTPLPEAKSGEHFLFQILFLIYLEKFHSLELLSTERLRQKSREKHADIGISGKYLATFLHGLDDKQKKKINKTLAGLYKNTEKLETTRKRAGWTELKLLEHFSENTRIWLSSQHISDGILRIIAILAALEGLKDGSTILIDEIENGIYPDLAHGFIKAMLEIAKKKNIQIIATTHSPAILNACPDESVVFVWRDDEGHVKAEPLFEDPKMKEQLEYMSPGAVWHTSTRKQITKTLERQHARKKKKEIKKK